MESGRIRGLRARLDLSQERFAQLLGVSLQTVRRWESSLARPLPIISLKLEELERQGRDSIHNRGGVPMRETKNRPEEPIEFGLGGLFKGLGSLFDVISKMVEEGKEEYNRSGETSDLGGKVKGVYGFSVKVGLGGKPVVEQFGNIKATEKGAVVAEVREPLVDVLDEGDKLVIIAELPGVEEKDIHIEIREDILELTAGGKDRKYSKELLLPSPVESKTMESAYRNGIMEIKLAKKK